jgi:hypothetical protein
MVNGTASFWNNAHFWAANCITDTVPSGVVRMTAGRHLAPNHLRIFWLILKGLPSFLTRSHFVYKDLSRATWEVGPHQVCHLSCLSIKKVEQYDCRRLGPFISQRDTCSRMLQPEFVMAAAFLSGTTILPTFSWSMWFMINIQFSVSAPLGRSKSQLLEPGSVSEFYDSKKLLNSSRMNGKSAVSAT